MDGLSLVSTGTGVGGAGGVGTGTGGGEGGGSVALMGWFENPVENEELAFAFCINKPSSF